MQPSLRNLKMSLEQPKLTTDLKTMLLKEFAESDISHGEWFDDDRRWCSVCQAPRFMCEPVENNMWADKTCSECTCLWPEFVEMVVYNLAYDEEFSEDLPDIILN